MDSLITQPASPQTPNAKKKKLIIAGAGVFALVLVGVVAYSMMSPAAVFKGSVAGATPSCVMPDGKTKGVPNKDTGVCEISNAVDVPVQTPAELCDAKDPQTHGWKIQGGSCINVKALCVPTTNQDGVLVGFEWAQVSPGNYVCREVAQEAPVMPMIKDDASCQSGKRNMTLAGGPSTCVLPTKAECNAKSLDLSVDGKSCVDRVAAIAPSQQVESSNNLDKDVMECMKSSNNDYNLCKNKLVKATVNDVSIDPELIDIKVNNSLCKAGEQFIEGTCSPITPKNENQAQFPAVGVKTPAGTVSASAGMHSQLAGNRLSAGPKATAGTPLEASKSMLAGSQQTPAKILLGDKPKATCTAPEVLQLDGSCKAKAQEVAVNVAASQPENAAAPAPSTINNYYYNNGGSDYVDQSTLDRIAALENQLAAANNQPAGEEVIQADPSVVAQMQNELSGLQTKVSNAKKLKALSADQAAQVAQAEAANGTPSPSSTTRNNAQNAKSAAVAINSNGLHGAAIRGESGPEVLLYPVIFGVVQGAYMLSKRRKK